MEGYTVIIMDETNKDLSKEKNSGMPVVRKQDSVKVASAKSSALNVYEKRATPPEKRGFFRNLKRKPMPSHGQLTQLLMENIGTFPEHEAYLLRSIFDLKSLTAQEIMVPLSELIPLTVEVSCAEIPKFCRASHYHYIPVYNDRVD